MITCELATITVEVDGNQAARIVVPAYTRELTDFLNTIDSIRDNYVRLQEIAGTQPSVADYGMFVLANAANDPRKQ
jgi:hypothetical protein